MNFLIFDKELLSSKLVHTILADFRHVTLITSSESSLSIPSSSPQFLLIKQVDISNAHQVIQSLSKHENDPFDAILIFNSTQYSDLHNILETMKRLKRQPPHLFFFFIGQQHEFDKSINKLLKEISDIISWTIVICNEINSSTTTKYQVQTKSNPNNQQPIAPTAVLDFVCDGIKTKKYLHETIYIY
ncbi:unnamed protein product [Rotaria sp. Silwood2]|nr:unnamed protein product [Rotaria sp. Silwood2]CAF2515434.1 unnamed protein product [Rotaria sp. Silwood2]CAF2750135.1 unnamed protein product [Rotaria sp. Silwood2]CAF2908849.1 unnamed protein product [Rotaria sp. Silwood2]CAF4090414.1 unnamed protein product [Rotaria sp. Silwood2]